MGSPFVKFEIKVMILSTLLILISVSLSSIESVLAQSDNTLGQDGDGNVASQSGPNSQETSQNNMCVSGESTSLSCNNLSSENTYRQTRDNGQSPLSLQGMIYQKSDSDTEDEGNYVATVSCDPGDTAISSNFKIDGVDNQNSHANILLITLDISNNQATVEIAKVIEEAVVTVYVNCFDNP